jgi:serine/threonine protein kinase
MAYHRNKDYRLTSMIYTPEAGTHFLDHVVKPSLKLKVCVMMPDADIKLPRSTAPDGRGLPFSILNLKNTQHDTKAFFIVSRYQVDAPGSFGRIKIAYRLQETTITDVEYLIIIDEKYFKLDPKPLALKISRQYDFGHTNYSSHLHPIHHYGSRKTQSLRFFTQKDMWAEGEDHIKHYQIMPYCPGDNLQDRIDDQNLDSRHIAQIKLLFKAKLDEIHDKVFDHHGTDHKGFVHRDIKPENVLVDFDESNQVRDLYIIDYDFMVPEGESVKPVGTLEYLSPKLNEIRRRRSMGIPASYNATKDDDIHAMEIIFTKLDRIDPAVTQQKKRQRLNSATTASSELSGVADRAVRPEQRQRHNSAITPSVPAATVSSRAVLMPPPLLAGPGSAPTSPTKTNPSSRRKGSLVDDLQGPPAKPELIASALMAKLSNLNK